MALLGRNPSDGPADGRRRTPRAQRRRLWPEQELRPRHAKAGAPCGKGKQPEGTSSICLAVTNLKVVGALVPNPLPQGLGALAQRPQTPCQGPDLSLIRPSRWPPQPTRALQRDGAQPPASRPPRPQPGHRRRQTRRYRDRDGVTGPPGDTTLLPSPSRRFRVTESLTVTGRLLPSHCLALHPKTAWILSIQVATSETGRFRVFVRRSFRAMASLSQAESLPPRHFPAKLGQTVRMQKRTALSL